MIGRRAVAGLLLLSALVFCAFAAPSASALSTTAYACVKAEPGTGGFADAHCTESQAKGSFAHQLITKAKTEFEVTNQGTKNKTTEAEPFILLGTIATIPVEVVCQTVGGSGNITNTEEAGNMHAGGEISMELTKCTVPKPKSCTVKEPIVYVGKFKTVQSGAQMGVEYVPMGGGQENFTEITFQGASCAVKGTLAINGSFEGTPNGATQAFTGEMCKLKWGGVAYTVQGAVTWKVKSGGEGIAFTTS